MQHTHKTQDTTARFAILLLLVVVGINIFLSAQTAQLLGKFLTLQRQFNQIQIQIDKSCLVSGRF